MRLIHRRSNGDLVLEDFSLRPKPKYAILSHTWGDPTEELIFTDFVEGRLHPDIVSNPNIRRYGLRKLEFCSVTASTDGLEYFWIDTCCIDKRSSEELGEAIRRMFEWYRNAVACYVYLADVSDGSDEGSAITRSSWENAFAASRWFTRGWTLQELLAPRDVRFYSQQGNLLCNKLSNIQQIREITGVPIEALRADNFSAFGYEERLQWAAGRRTTKEEDRAYCLLGLFNIHIPLLYGEGEQAFERLKQELQRKSDSTESNLVSRTLTNPDTALEELITALQFDECEERFASIRNHHKDTCQWILKSDELKQWRDPNRLQNHHGFFWIKGKPGSGKSTLTKFLFKKTKARASGAIVISFFFNARGSELQKSTCGLYRSLICQLLEVLSPAETRMITRYSRYGSSSWTVSILRNLFEDIIQHGTHRQVIVFVDALDECDEDEVREMVSCFERLGEHAIGSDKIFHVCFSSRHYPFIRVRRSVEMTLESQPLHARDIDLYLQTELDIDGSKLASELRDEIRTKAAGVFLWVVLVTEILNLEHGRGRILQMRKKLEEIPPDLHDLFKRILTRDNENLNETTLCLQWVLYARRELRPEELYFAVQCGPHGDEVGAWNAEEIPLSAIERFIINSSKGLAEVTKGQKPKVQFIHESVRDFLRGAHGFSRDLNSFGADGEGRIHEILKQICQDYLNKAMRLLTAEQVREAQIATNKARQQLATDLTSRYPFLQYAMQHVLSHADLAQQGSVSQSQFVLEFPSEKWILAHDIFEKLAGRRYHDEHRVSPEYIFAEFGCVGLLKCLPSRQAFGEVTEAQYRYPFIVALVAKKGAAALDTLLSDDIDKLSGYQIDDIKGEIDGLITCAETLSGDERRGRPSLLYFLAYSGALALFKYCLFEFHNNTEISAPTKNDMEICLVLGARGGHMQIIHYLIDAGVNIDAQLAATEGIHPTLLALDKRYSVGDSVGRSAIEEAVQQGHEEAVRFLRSVGHVKHRPRCFTVAVSRGHSGMVKILIDAGEDLEAEFPMSLDQAYPEKEMVNLLIAAAASQRLAKALTLGIVVVVSHKDEDTLRRLLAMGLDVNVAFKEERLPIFTNEVPLGLACEKGLEQIVDLLLQAGADVHKCSNHETAFCRAAKAGHLNIMQMLLNAGADIDAQASSRRYGNALHVASSNGKEQVVKFLLDREADPNVSVRHCLKIDRGHLLYKNHNALEAACESGYERIVRMLLDAGADANFQCSRCDLNAMNIEHPYISVDPKTRSMIRQMVFAAKKRGVNTVE